MNEETKQMIYKNPPIWRGFYKNFNRLKTLHLLIGVEIYSNNPNCDKNK